MRKLMACKQTCTTPKQLQCPHAAEQLHPAAPTETRGASGSLLSLSTYRHIISWLQARQEDRVCVTVGTACTAAWSVATSSSSKLCALVRHSACPVPSLAHLMMPMMGVLRVWLRATNDGKLWLMWIRMSHQLMWLLTMPTGCTSALLLLLLPPLRLLPLLPPALPLPLPPSCCPTLIHVTRQNPHHQRHTRQCQLPSLATQSLRTLAGSRKLRRQHNQKLTSASSAPVSLMGSTCGW